MFDLGAPEVLLLLVNVAGILLPVAALVAKRVSVGIAILAVALALFVPFLGGAASILIVLTRWQRHVPAR